MVNKVKYWLNLADENLISARWLLKGSRHLDMAFFCHQVMEKALKATVASIAEISPPKIHDLKKLAKQGNIFDRFSDKQLDFLIELDPFNIEARYPDYKENVAKTLTAERCSKILEKTEDLLCWIKSELEK